jgi:hypothetical protein
MTRLDEEIKEEDSPIIEEFTPTDSGKESLKQGLILGKEPEPESDDKQGNL